MIIEKSNVELYCSIVTWRVKCGGGGSCYVYNLPVYNTCGIFKHLYDVFLQCNIVTCTNICIYSTQAVCVLFMNCVLSTE